MYVKEAENKKFMKIFIKNYFNKKRLYDYIFI